MSSDGTDIETLRNYIDKVDRAFVSTAASESRLLLANSLISVVLGAVGLGAVSVDERIEIQGIAFSAPLSSLLLAGAVASVTLTTLFWATVSHASSLQLELMRLYGQAGFEVPAGTDSSRNPWASAGPFETAVPGAEPSRFKVLAPIELLLGVAVVVVLALMPIAAQAIACVRASQALGGDWAWLLLLLPATSALGAAALATRHD